MEDLIKALQIFLKYNNDYAPTQCSHDELRVNVNPSDVSPEDKKALKKLGFEADKSTEDFYSFRFGSC